MNFTQYLKESALVLIPALYIIGMIIKNTERIHNKYIPIILLGCGIAGAVGLLGFNMQAVIQGILVTGASVYTDQVVKQCKKDKWNRF